MNQERLMNILFKYSVLKDGLWKIKLEIRF